MTGLMMNADEVTKFSSHFVANSIWVKFRAHFEYVAYEDIFAEIIKCSNTVLFYCKVY